MIQNLSNVMDYMIDHCSASQDLTSWVEGSWFCFCEKVFLLLSRCCTWYISSWEQPKIILTQRLCELYK